MTQEAVDGTGRLLALPLPRSAVMACSPLCEAASPPQHLLSPLLASSHPHASPLMTPLRLYLPSVTSQARSGASLRCQLRQTFASSLGAPDRITKCTVGTTPLNSCRFPVVVVVVYYLVAASGLNCGMGLVAPGHMGSYWARD